MDRDSLSFDVVIVGAGPAGLSAAIRLGQLAKKNGLSLSICLLEKGARLGAHTLSGAIVDPRSLNELLPDWKECSDFLNFTLVKEDFFWLLRKNRYFSLPKWLLPACLKNKDYYVGSLGRLVQWLGLQAERLGVDIYPGFPVSKILYDSNGAVRGVQTKDVGVSRSGDKSPQFQSGVNLFARYTLFAEGARGSLGRELIEHFGLDQNKDPQSYSIGFKELWSVDPALFSPGRVVHTIGWPMKAENYGGGFLYHLQDNKVSVGYVVGLNYRNPYTNPFKEFQLYKTHPAIRRILLGGVRLSYGARAIAAGGLNSMPHLVFPGGSLIGCEAGFLNPAKIKGSHSAMKSGMLAAEAVFSALSMGRSSDVLVEYPQSFEKSWLYDELYQARNFKPVMAKGFWKGAFLFGIDQFLFRGRSPINFHVRTADNTRLTDMHQCSPQIYPKPDGECSFDLESSVALSGVSHEVDQPSHLKLKDVHAPVLVNLLKFGGPEQYYCPAGVYEFVKDADGNDQLLVHPQNCLHCKVCDIKDPLQNIVWTPPEGGGGPNYVQM